MIRPQIDFFLIGAARSGTTSLYRLLESHPDVFTPAVKEPRFFKEHWERGWEWYRSLYETAPEAQLCGDFSPSYSAHTSGQVAQRIHRYYPDAKIVYIVRHPVDCAISSWRMAAEIHGELLPFGESLDRWRSAIVLRTLYFQQLSFYRKFFPDERILVLTLEKIKREDREIDRLFDFLGIARSDARFPRANRSDLKPSRPAPPETSLAERRAFLDAVSPDAAAMLHHLGLPLDFWPLSEDYQGWRRL